MSATLTSLFVPSPPIIPFVEMATSIKELHQSHAYMLKTVLSVYVEMGLLDLASSMFSEMPVKNLESWNFLLSGYAKCGMLDEARRLFDEMVTKDVVSWNILITGYANASRYDEVLLLFKDMQRERVKPDNRTLVTLLSSCAGIGSLTRGKWIHAFIDKHGIEINGFLATALVDMYTKCGCIEKALEVFNNTAKKDVSTWNAMIAGLSIHGCGRFGLIIEGTELVGKIPEKESHVMWESLLSACRNHGNIELAENIARKLFELNHKDNTGYVQLSNIHASEGQWSSVSDVRRKMRENQISKEPGGSMIEVDGTVHEFLAGQGMIF